jgi:hypothetical protein
MIVVADSGPPHYLILIEQIELLRRFYGQVAIPDAVANELRAAGSPTAVSNWNPAPCGGVSHGCEQLESCTVGPHLRFSFRSKSWRHSDLGEAFA